jgi:hypothetical protein
MQVWPQSLVSWFALVCRSPSSGCHQAIRLGVRRSTIDALLAMQLIETALDHVMKGSSVAAQAAFRIFRTPQQ